MASTLTTRYIEVTGVVQGVGFRPFIYKAATSLGLTGVVGNDSTKVFIEVAGTDAQIDSLIELIHTDAPPLARVESVSVKKAVAVESTSANTFEIVDSRHTSGQRTLVSPDTAVCADCVGELFDPTDRRFGHPFITCTNCGPRLSIITDLPYDRANTTMARFEMCATCEAEYSDPTDRRYHAQPIGCHDCGPQLSFGYSIDGVGQVDPIGEAAEVLANGGVLAVKGVGGYHLMCDATNADAIAGLRRRKNRPDKPFAIMVASLDHARTFAHLAPLEEAELASPAAPIVLARRRTDAALPALLAPASPLLGMVLPYTPVHLLLLAEVGVPLVVTSANPAGAPLCHASSAIAQISDLYDGVLEHDREIVVPVDDSVVRLVGNSVVPVRRARGFAPMPFTFPSSERNVLAVGGELKNTFCVARGGHAWVSQHIGDMENLETSQAFEEMVESYSTMYEVEPDVVAIDAHPGYLSSKWARQNSAEPVLEVQHHHGHIAAVMAEHGLDPHTPVLGFAFDGTGYGSDGHIWGGEALVATASNFSRVGHLHPVLLPGGDAAVRNPNRVALAHLAAAGVEWTNDLAPVAQLTDGERQLLSQQLDRSIACVPTTSMGRLFDAVASLIGVRHQISYEAQAAIELEILAESGDAQPGYVFGLGDDGAIDQRPVIRDIVADLGAGETPANIAWKFHDAVAEVVERLARRVCAEHSLDTVVLSGGVFQNALLLQLCIDRLSSDFDVRTHQRVPANDGGLSLGQAFVAAYSKQDSTRTSTGESRG